jgi:hypothetical protein
MHTRFPAKVAAVFVVLAALVVGGFFVVGAFSDGHPSPNAPPSAALRRRSHQSRFAFPRPRPSNRTTSTPTSSECAHYR